MDGDPRPTAQQLAQLRRLAARPDAPPAVARRARIALAEAERQRAGPGGRGAASPAAARWLHRYLQEGPAGLADRPRSGRPRLSPDDADRLEAARSILVAPLLTPTVGWTSRTIAELTGSSQSAVARTWARLHPTGPDPLAGRVPGSGLRLVAATASPGNSLLVLAGSAVDAAAAPPPGTFMRSPRRPPLQTLLAADALARTRRDRPDGGDGAPAPDPASDPAPDPASDLAVIALARAEHGPHVPLYVLTRRPLVGLDRADPGGGPAPRVLVVDDPLGWARLLAPLVRRCTQAPAGTLVSMQHRAMEWARSGRPRFTWTDTATGAPRRSLDRRPGELPRARSQALADQVLDVLLEGITSGRLTAGDRITEAFLARAVRTSRSHVRDAVRSLASAGLVDLEPHRGALVPTPQVADVIETYAARRVLGTLLLRRAARLPAGELAPLETGLDHLLEVAATQDAHATGEADLRFQDTLAAVTGMRRIPQLFFALTAQLRLHIAVMGLNYTYSIPAMCRDDSALLEHLRRRDEAEALATWHAKIDDALTYMTRQVARSRPAAQPLRPG